MTNTIAARGIETDWVFPDETIYRARIADIQERLRAEGIDVLVALSLIHI